MSQKEMFLKSWNASWQPAGISVVRRFSQPESALAGTAPRGMRYCSDRTLLKRFRLRSSVRFLISREMMAHGTVRCSGVASSRLGARDDQKIYARTVKSLPDYSQQAETHQCKAFALCAGGQDGPSRERCPIRADHRSFLGWRPHGPHSTFRSKSFRF